MPEPVLRLDSDRVTVRPGGQASVTLTVANPGTVVEGYRLSVLGPTAWAEVSPAEISVYPGEDASATVTFSPPSGVGAPGGDHPFGVLARSTVDASASAAVEGDVTVGEVYGIAAKLVPVTSTGRWQGRHAVLLENWGNAAARIRLSASNPDEALGFYLRPETVDVPLGGRSTVRLAVRARRPFLRGAPVRLPFQVIGTREDNPPAGLVAPHVDPGLVVVDGALNQRPILSRGFVTAVALLVVGAVAAGVYVVRQQGAAADEQLAARQVPGPPTGFSVTPLSPTSAQLDWNRSRGVDGYLVERVVPGSEPAVVSDKPLTVDPNQTRLAVADLAPGARACFRISAVGGVRGRPTDPVCATLPAPPPTPSPSPTSTDSAGSSGSPTSSEGSPTNSTDSASTDPSGGVLPELQHGVWIAALDSRPDTAEARARADTLAASLSAKVLRTRSYHHFIFELTGAKPGVDSVIVYRGPLDQASAEQVCADANASPQPTPPGVGPCFVAQPDRDPADTASPSGTTSNSPRSS